MTNVESDNQIKITDEVDRICSSTLKPLGIFYFQFKRVFKNKPPIILANNLNFFEEFMKGEFIELQIYHPLDIRQSQFYFWDEIFPEKSLVYLKETLGIYHGLTILNRYKDVYDCASFAMSELHSFPVAHYLYVLKELQAFAELFLIKAKYLMKETTTHAVTIRTMQQYGSSKNSFFLPKKSVRINLGEASNMYVTSYEAFCVQLIRQGKTYKEIGSILSMEAGSVKTLLSRLKTRTGLSLQEVALQLLHSQYATGRKLNSEKKGITGRNTNVFKEMKETNN